MLVVFLYSENIIALGNAKQSITNWNLIYSKKYTGDYSRKLFKYLYLN